MKARRVIALGLLIASPAAADSRAPTTSVAEPSSLRWRGGLQLGAGALLPTTAPAVGIGVRLGRQYRRLGFLIEAGGFLAYARDVSDPEDSTVTAMVVGHLTPTVEYDVGRQAFVSGGAMLGSGIWGYSKHRTSPTGAVSSESGGAASEDLLAFLPGLDLRGGWRTGTGAHRLVVAVGVRVVLADAHRATASISAAGDTRSSDQRRVSVTATPMLAVGYDFAR